MNFTTPEVSVLIVDDNEINLEVTAEFLAPLQMKIDMADSGKQALQLAEKKRYHLIFMDHMMPVMDGVETTKRLRKLKDEYYRTVPVIALTANALEDVKEEFQAAGMSDYLAKPVEAIALYKCVLKWLPRKLIVVSGTTRKSQETVQKSSGTARRLSDTAQKPSDTARKSPEAVRETSGTGADDALPQLPGINAADGIRYSGSKKLWRKLLGDFYKLIDTKANKMEQCLADGLIKDYTIEVHAMKNTARMIGAAHLSEWFFKMEKCGKAGDVETITRETPGLLQELRSFKDILRPFGEENDRNKQEAPASEWIAVLNDMRDAMERFNLDAVDLAMQQLEGYRVPEDCSELMDQLRAAVADVAMKEVMDTAGRMIGILKKRIP